MRHLSLFFLAISATLFGKLSIKLETHDKLIPTALHAIEMKESGRQAGLYERQLENILRFDFSYTGKVILVDPKTEMKLRITAEGDGYPLSSKETMAPQLTLRTYISSNTITVQCSGFGETKACSAPLTGVLARDRVRIHQICDKLHEVLFGMKGIASKKLVYTHKCKDPSIPGGYRAEIWESDWDGAGAHRISSARDFALTPIYIPLEKEPKVLYVNYRTGQSKLHVLDLKEKTSRPFLTIRGNQMLPEISANREQLAFISDAAGSADLFIVDLKNKGKPVRFSYGRGVTHATPTFNPRGSQVAFVSNKSGSPQIYITEVQFKNKPQLKLLCEKNRQNTCPAWSPDGTKLIYVGLTDGVRQLWIYDFATQSEKQLTFDPVGKECPRWAPSSQHVVYNTTDRAELYMLALGHKEPVKISRGQGEKKFPAWQP